MSFRAIWIVSKDSLQDKGHLLFTRLLAALICHQALILLSLFHSLQEQPARRLEVLASHSSKKELASSMKYPTVERRCNLIHERPTSDGLPEDNQIIKSVFDKLQIGRKTFEFIEDHDGCQQSKQEPVLKLDINDEILWPVIAVQKLKLVFICVCLVERKEFDCNIPLYEIPAISIGYALIHNIIELLESPSADNNPQLSSQIEELGMLLKILMPFGTPSDTSFGLMKSFLTGQDITWSPKYRYCLFSVVLPSYESCKAPNITYALVKPTEYFAAINVALTICVPSRTYNVFQLSAWRPSTGGKTKNQLHITIREQVSAVIYNETEKSVYQDMCCVYGTVSCKADVDGVPEVSLNFNSKPSIHIAFHPCLQWVDIASSAARISSVGDSSADLYRAAEQAPVSRNISFTPPRGVFPLCHMNGESRPPVEGVYQLKTEKKATCIHITLQLGEGVKNMFEYFEVHIPFFRSGPIHKWDFKNTWGTLLISPERRKLVWSIGQKFPKTLKITLNSTVYLTDANEESERSNFKEDPFCQGLNTYIEIFFKSASNCVSGISVAPKSINVNPSASPKVYIVNDLVSKDYKIWNTFGDAIVAFPPIL